jgi:hypothetical protein
VCFFDLGSYSAGDSTTSDSSASQQGLLLPWGEPWLTALVMKPLLPGWQAFPRIAELFYRVWTLRFRHQRACSRILERGYSYSKLKNPVYLLWILEGSFKSWKPSFAEWIHIFKTRIR